MITISHSYAEGTLIDGMTRGDGSYEIVTGLGWRWFRSLNTCGIRHSRDRISKDWMINQTADALRAAGHDVDIQIDNNPRPVADREADGSLRDVERISQLGNRIGMYALSVVSELTLIVGVERWGWWARSPVCRTRPARQRVEARRVGSVVCW